MQLQHGACEGTVGEGEEERQHTVAGPLSCRWREGWLQFTSAPQEMTIKTVYSERGLFLTVKRIYIHTKGAFTVTAD